ncbi:hypothetical protein [Rahnella aceris]|uniref:Uncharacterized protein n=1 Tax=Rahnella sp. (strain Y9602) TaxID=2703885 RepID=A0ABW6CH32_RAHSY
METVTLKVNGNPDLSFTGQMMARERDPQTGITSVVYETPKGNWLVARINLSSILIDYKVIEEKSEKALIEYLGFDNIAKAIYEQLDIDTTNKMDI